MPYKRKGKRNKYEHNYRSNSEYNTSLVLLKNNIEFQYESDNIPYEWREDKKYIPDFILPNGIILEVKGRFMLEDRKKHLFIRDQHPEVLERDRAIAWFFASVGVTAEDFKTVCDYAGVEPEYMRDFAFKVLKSGEVEYVRKRINAVLGH